MWAVPRPTRWPESATHLEISSNPKTNYFTVTAGGQESVSLNTISTEEKPHITEVRGERNVFILGEDDNIQGSTMDEILSGHVSQQSSRVPCPDSTVNALTLSV